MRVQTLDERLALAERLGRVGAQRLRGRERDGRREVHERLVRRAAQRMPAVEVQCYAPHELPAAKQLLRRRVERECLWRRACAVGVQWVRPVRRRDGRRLRGSPARRARRVARGRAGAGQKCKMHTHVAEGKSQILHTPTRSQLTTPDQLGDWIESLLAQVETRLDERNKQVAARMNDMSDRIDALESSIQGASPPLTELVHAEAPNS